MIAQHAWSAIRSILLWGIPIALVATLVWTFLPHGGAGHPVAAPPRAPASSRPPSVDPPPPAVEPPGTWSAEPEPATPPFAEIRLGDLEGTDESGRPQWRIVADAVTVVHDKDTVLLRNVHATLYEPNGGTIVVTGARGRFDTKTHEVEIRGGVHGTSSTGRELFADQVHWVPRQGKITGTGHIRLIQERVVMYADGMLSDTTLGRTQFFGHVRASVR